jgi:hypothetical protein
MAYTKLVQPLILMSVAFVSCHISQSPWIWTPKKYNEFLQPLKLEQFTKHNKRNNLHLDFQ